MKNKAKAEAKAEDIKSLEIHIEKLPSGDVVLNMSAGQYGGLVQLNQIEDFPNRGIGERGMKPGDIISITARGESSEAFVVGFSDPYITDDKTESCFTKVWIIPRVKISPNGVLKYALISYPGDYFALTNFIKVIRKTNSPLKPWTTKRRILYFLNH